MIRKCRKAQDILDTLTELPTSLDQHYERILESIDKKYHPEAFAALKWLITSKRPLSLIELAEAAVTQPTGFDPQVRFLNPVEILRI